jgi:hypothetical protein
MAVETKLVKMIQFVLNNELITAKCSASQRLVKYIFFKITTCILGTKKIYGREHNFGTVMNFFFNDAVYCIKCT